MADREGSGTDRRLAQLVLAAGPCGIHLVVPEAPRDPVVAALVSSVEVIPRQPLRMSRSRSRRWTRNDGWFHFGPRREIAIAAPWTAAVEHALKKIIDRVRPDLVVLDHAGLAPLIVRRRRKHERWMLTLHDVGSQIAQRQAAVATQRRLRRRLRRERVKSKFFEEWCMETFDSIVCTCQADADLMGGPVAVVPNGVDCSALTALHPPKEPVVVFAPDRFTESEVDAITWFAHEVWPLVIAKEPATHLMVVGAEPPAAVLQLASDSITVDAGRLSRATHFRRASVAVLPMRMGGNCRPDALEALASGRAVVGTSIGLSGLPVDDQTHVVVTDEAGAFGDAIVRLLTDPDTATRLGAAAVSMIQEHALCWTNIGPEFARLLVYLASP